MPLASVLSAIWRRPTFGLGLLLAASLALGVARAWAAPPGYNVDEWARMPAALRAAECWRQTARWIGRTPGAVSPEPCWRAGHLNGNPAYYLLLSAPLAAIPDARPSDQYYAARLVTVGLGLATLWLAWLTCLELLGSGRTRLALGIAASAALNQGFGDIVSGVNSDASAAAALGLLLYAMARIEAGRRLPGRRLRVWVVDIGLLSAGVGLCVFSTPSARWLAIPVIAWWLVSQWGVWARLGAAAVVAGLLLVLLIPGGLVEWTTPQHWFNAGPTEILGASRRIEAGGPLGPHVLRVQLSSGRQSKEEVQFLPDHVAHRLAGRILTFGAWARAPRGEPVQGPIWDDGSQRVTVTVTATGEWQFVAATAQVSPGASTGAIFLAPLESGEPVSYDGLVLAEGAFPIDAPPEFADESGRAGTWGGERFANLLLNPSVEATWPTLRVTGLHRDVIAYNGRIRSLLAWQRTAPSYATVVSWLFAGFWSEFSGLHPGLSRLQLLPFALLAATGAGGALRTAFAPAQRAAPELRHAVRFFAPVAILIWLVVVLRADLWPNLPSVLSFAGARYAVAATVPTLALLTIGILYWLPARAQPWALAALALGLWLVALHVLLRAQIPFYECLLGGGEAGKCLGGN